ncbi:hypothetical protein Syn7502_00175 [Synechococcus sp. PCC 7502]|uniref:hypothetical protein n=1 Tax=Synechococcus sp. PCC 7502 TaxID=1173263 RepID=UPI00029F976A|nr:hypothetical protein [Synechococcus sp. PCC 7502]AFY72343.1 hypothetical protein Syn7502_00175 [Synechococcus sp. PCC 7502]
MARFQSKLFNWLDNSLPVKLGRRVRNWYEEVGNPVRQATETIKKTTTKAILYPIYILAASTNIQSKSKQIPLLLKPVQSLVLWIDRNHIFSVQKSSYKTHQSTYKPTHKSSVENSQISRYLQSKKLFLFNQTFNLTTVEDNPEATLNRIQKLIRDAIAYFFGNKHNRHRFKSTQQSSKQFSNKSSDQNNQPWLAMADVFDDDATVWPPKSQAIANQLAIDKGNRSSVNLSNSSSKTESHEITSAQRKDLAESTPPRDSSRPLHAWIDTQFTFLGYVYSPFIQILHWLDYLIAIIEKWIFRLWQYFAGFMCRLFRF